MTMHGRFSVDRRIPATCFLTTSVIGNDRLIWLNELNWFLHRHQPLAQRLVASMFSDSKGLAPSAVVSLVIERFEPERVESLLRELRAATGVDPAALAREACLHLDWGQVEEMRSAGVTFGNHTLTHPPLARLPVEACKQEIGAAGKRLAHLPGATSALAYPFGSRDEATRALAIELGYRCLLEVEGVNASFDPTRIGRVNIRSDSAAVLFARMEVVAPVKAVLKRLLRLVRKPRGAITHPSILN